MEVRDCIIPIKTAFAGISCLNCMDTNDNLLTCSKCKRAKYCDRSCQKADWKIHKHECKLVCSFQDNFASIPGNTLLLKTLAHKNMMELTMPEETRKYVNRYMRFLQFGKVCSVCGKNDYEFSDAASWVNCPTCKYGWCCCQEHFDQYRTRHTQEICDMYVTSIAANLFLWSHAKNNNEQFVFTPDSLMTVPMETFPTSWDDFFRIRCPDIHAYSQASALPAALLPASTKELSQPATCLYAMYLHGIDDFQDKNSLTIHIVGASFSYEMSPSCVWEEILHCLPGVRLLHMVFVGPEALINCTPPTTELVNEDTVCCPKCVVKGRTRSTSFFAKTYHDYKASPRFSTPDLIVAFNTGMYEDDTESWKTSLEVMMDMNVPALFTSYNRSESDQDIGVLSSVNAELVTERPLLNPVRVAYAEIEGAAGGSVDSFFHQNMYCMAFKGRA